MKKITSLFLILTLIILTFSVTGCSRKEKLTDYSFDYFDTITTIIGYENDADTFKENCKKIKGWLSEYHRLYDIYTTYDGLVNLCTINRSQGETLKVDPKIIELLEFSKDLHSKNPKFNIAMGSLLSVWHDYREYGINHPEDAVLPSSKELQEAAGHIDFSNLVIDSKNNTVLISDPELTLDVGAIAKGFAAEKVAEKMLKNGMKGYLLNLGGNVKIVGKHQGNKKWTVGIENPDKTSAEAFVAELSLGANMSLVTSGSYQRYFTVEGKNYNHIIDSSTLYPAEYFTSVSILCEDSGLADGLSTLLFCLPYEDGKKIIEGYEDVHALWITADGEKLYSENFKDFLK